VSKNLTELSDIELSAYLTECNNNVSKFDKSQHSVKILLNSLYGALGSPFFRMYDKAQAEGITLSGQAVVTQSYIVFNDYLNTMLKTNTDYAVASDTDSVYVNLTPLVDALFPKDTSHDQLVDGIVGLCDGHFSDMLAARFAEYAIETNAYTNAIDMKREAVATACFVAKKNYVMRVYDNEGTRYATPKLKITGLEAIKSSTPKFFQDKLKAGYSFVFDKTESDVHSFVDSVYKEYAARPIESIAATISVTELEKYIEGDGFKSGTPGHVKAAVTYNNCIESHNLGNKYHKIRAGDKIKIISLKMPNPLKQKYFAYLDKFPHEFIPEKYIDRDSNYEKYFVTPLNRVLGTVKWNHEYTSSLEDFF